MRLIHFEVMALRELGERVRCFAQREPEAIQARQTVQKEPGTAQESARASCSDRPTASRASAGSMKVRTRITRPYCSSKTNAMRRYTCTPLAFPVARW
jgi:hypothetical protein